MGLEHAALPGQAPVRFSGALRNALALLLVGLVLWWVGPAELVRRFAHADLAWACAGIAVIVPQLALLAWRWQLTAAALGVQLGYPLALREYALSLLLNQALPLGVAGDAQRVLRHSRRLRVDLARDQARDQARDLAPEAGALGVALRAVLIERASGQLVVVGWALAAWPLWASRLHLPPASAFGSLALMLLLAVAVLTLRRLPALSQTRPARELSALLRDFGAAFGSPRRVLAQLVLSSAITASIVLQLAMAVRSLGFSLPWPVLVRVVPFMLLAMALPLTAAGWGVREAATATLYQLAGLSPADGLSVSLLFGAISLLASVLGLLLLLPGRRR